MKIRLGRRRTCRLPTDFLFDDDAAPGRGLDRLHGLHGRSGVAHVRPATPRRPGRVPRPAPPPEDVEKHDEDPDDHQDHADRGHVQTAHLRIHGPGKDGPERGQEKTHYDTHYSGRFPALAVRNQY